MKKKHIRCDKCRRNIRPENIIKGPHGKLCPECYPMVKQAHHETFYKMSRNRHREHINVDF